MHRVVLSSFRVLRGRAGRGLVRIKIGKDQARHGGRLGRALIAGGQQGRDRLEEGKARYRIVLKQDL